ncbi:hypothetical protein LCGC14_1620180 [marine sediment metagenome]|uniref:Uncharacterized protein n=1 Tax=marine sediment metagenome TaxID=412755 RepID=A0A0F9I5R9_9ZZZZ
MVLIALGLRRAVAIKLIPKAFKGGLSASSFIQQLRLKGLTYRRTTMLSDWRTVNEIEAKKDVLKYIRKDRLPSIKSMADVEWAYDKEYIYKANTWSRINPDDPLTERMVTFTSDKPLTPRQVEEQIADKWSAWERYFPEKVERIQTVSAYHRIESPLDVE